MPTIGTLIRGSALALLGVSAAQLGCSRRVRSGTVAAPAPPCYPTGVYHARAERTFSSGGICSLNDLRVLNGDLSVEPLGPGTVRVHQRGQYAHTSNVDAFACAIWTNQSPTFSRNVFGATVGGFAGYRANVRPDGTLDGTVQLTVVSSSPFVPGCTASFRVTGRRAY